MDFYLAFSKNVSVVVVQRLPFLPIEGINVNVLVARREGSETPHRGLDWIGSSILHSSNKLWAERILIR